MNVDPQKIAATISMKLLSNGKNHKNHVFYNYTMKIIAVNVVYDKCGRPKEWVSVIGWMQSSYRRVVEH